MQTLLLIISSLFYFLAFLLSLNPKSQKLLRKLPAISGPLSLLSAVVGIQYFLINGSDSIQIFSVNGLGVSLRIDSISLIMHSMVSIIAYFVYRFSINYLSGDSKFRKFAGLFSLIAGSVQMLVLSGNLFFFFVFWVLTSVGLQKMLQLYPERKKAIRASKIKFLIARLADITLLSAFILIYKAVGSGDIQDILYSNASLTALQTHNYLWAVTFLLGITAILKSVQFPFHTWIFGVLELPTPVSALLHAGLLNAGPFLIIRFSMLFSGMEGVSSFILIVGAVSAIFGSTVFITQSSVKSGLVFSSIGHMGFSLMLCGMGLYAAALLHLVSHSFYKAYLFLRSGSTVAELKMINRRVYMRSGSPKRVIGSLVLAVIFFLGISMLTSQVIELPESLYFVGVIMFLGVFALLVYSIDSLNTFQASLRIVLSGMVVLMLFYSMEALTNLLVMNDILNHEPLGSLRTIAGIVVIGFFFLATLLQIIVMIPSKRDQAAALRVHLRNGFYIDTFYQKLGRTWN